MTLACQLLGECLRCFTITKTAAVFHDLLASDLSCRLWAPNHFGPNHLEISRIGSQGKNLVFFKCVETCLATNHLANSEPNIYSARLGFIHHYPSRSSYLRSMDSNSTCFFNPRAFFWHVRFVVLPPAAAQVSIKMKTPPASYRSKKK